MGTKIHVPIPKNPAYKPFYTDPAEVCVLYGGGGSGKSVAIAQKLIRRCLEERPKTPHKFLALRKVQTDLDESVVAELQDAIDVHGTSHDWYYHKTKKDFTHLPSGNKILCRGGEKISRFKSIKNISGIWMEEASEFTQEEFDQLLIRIRGYREMYVQWILSFNPVDEDIWLKDYIEKNRNSPHLKVYHTTYKDNRFLSQRDKERLEGMKLTNPLYYDVYCLGKWGVVDKSGKFAYSFNQDIHVREDITFNPNLPLWLSFDFNIDPMTVNIAQRKDIRTLHILDEIRMDNSDIHQVLDVIKAKYAQYTWIATGDASGTNQTGMVRGKLNYWRVIVNELQLRQEQVRKRSKNIGLIDSRVLVNAVLQTTDFAVHPRCENIIHDLKYAKTDDSGLLVKDREKNKNDFLDGTRYLVDANYPDILVRNKKYEKYKQAV